MKQINDVDNNILLDCKKDASFYLKWASRLKFPHYGCNIRRNIMVQDAFLMKGEGRIAPFYESSKCYDQTLRQPMVDDNILYCSDDQDAAEAALLKAQELGRDRDSVADDPMSVDLEKGDFRFKDSSPALKLGITPITKYGIQEPYGLADDYLYVAK